jgi:4-hydroxyphenylpyruvate dioxygenase
MRKAIATVSLSGTLRQKLEAAAAARFDAIELFENDFVHFDGTARQLAAMAADLGLSIDLYQPFRDFEGMPEALYRRSLDRAEHKFDVMQELGAPLMLVCSNTSPSALGDPGLAAEQLHVLAERAARRNLRVGFEALAWGRHVSRYGQAWDIVSRANHPHLGLILDSFHTLSLKDDPSAIARIPAGKIFFVQMADAPLLSMDVVQWARHHRNFPHQGQFDVDGFFEHVLLSGYTGTLSLEIFNDMFRETPNRRTAVDAMRSLLFLESRVRRRLAQRGDAARGSLQRVALFDPPVARPFDGIAFVEFGADEPTAALLDEWLERLGFARAGVHRTKRATLYRQGHVNLVVNAQSGSDARSRFDEQGPCVSAIGLLTDDAEQARAHATALLSAAYDSPLAADELRLPAIRSPGGMLVHFVPAALGAQGLAQADFGADAAAPQGAGIVSVDHLGLGMTADQLDTWVLFGRSVLGLRSGDNVELADPFGLVRRCTLADAERHLRIVFDVSSSQRTLTARTVAATGGKPSVHHLSLACDDLPATVQMLRDRGVPFVRISDNYYDDLQARLGLEPDRVEQLRRLGLLFDRSDTGQYLHIYTQPFAERFFFELVQRDGYDAYGAGNPALRMAAEAQAAEAPAR